MLVSRLLFIIIISSILLLLLITISSREQQVSAESVTCTNGSPIDHTTDTTTTLEVSVGPGCTSVRLENFVVQSGYILFVGNILASNVDIVVKDITFNDDTQLKTVHFDSDMRAKSVLIQGLKKDFALNTVNDAIASFVHHDGDVMAITDSYTVRNLRFKSKKFEVTNIANNVRFSLVIFLQEFRDVAKFELDDFDAGGNGFIFKGTTGGIINAVYFTQIVSGPAASKDTNSLIVRNINFSGDILRLYQFWAVAFWGSELLDWNLVLVDDVHLPYNDFLWNTNAANGNEYALLYLGGGGTAGTNVIRNINHLWLRDSSMKIRATNEFNRQLNILGLVSFRLLDTVNNITVENLEFRECFIRADHDTLTMHMQIYAAYFHQGTENGNGVVTGREMSLGALTMRNIVMRSMRVVTNKNGYVSLIFLNSIVQLPFREFTLENFELDGLEITQDTAATAPNLVDTVAFVRFARDATNHPVKLNRPSFTFSARNMFARITDLNLQWNTAEVFGMVMSSSSSTDGSEIAQASKFEMDNIFISVARSSKSQTSDAVQKAVKLVGFQAAVPVQNFQSASGLLSFTNFNFHVSTEVTFRGTGPTSPHSVILGVSTEEALKSINTVRIKNFNCRSELRPQSSSNLYDYSQGGNHAIFQSGSEASGFADFIVENVTMKFATTSDKVGWKDFAQKVIFFNEGIRDISNSLQIRNVFSETTLHNGGEKTYLYGIDCPSTTQESVMNVKQVTIENIRLRIPTCGTRSSETSHEVHVMGLRFMNGIRKVSNGIIVKNILIEPIDVRVRTVVTFRGFFVAGGPINEIGSSSLEAFDPSKPPNQQRHYGVLIRNISIANVHDPNTDRVTTLSEQNTLAMVFVNIEIQRGIGGVWPVFLADGLSVRIKEIYAQCPIQLFSFKWVCTPGATWCDTAPFSGGMPTDGSTFLARQGLPYLYITNALMDVPEYLYRADDAATATGGAIRVSILLIHEQITSALKMKRLVLDGVQIKLPSVEVQNRVQTTAFWIFSAETPQLSGISQELRLSNIDIITLTNGGSIYPKESTLYFLHAPAKDNGIRSISNIIFSDISLGEISLAGDEMSHLILFQHDDSISETDDGSIQQIDSVEFRNITTKQQNQVNIQGERFSAKTVFGFWYVNAHLARDIGRILVRDVTVHLTWLTCTSCSTGGAVKLFLITMNLRDRSGQAQNISSVQLFNTQVSVQELDGSLASADAILCHFGRLHNPDLSLVPRQKFRPGEWLFENVSLRLFSWRSKAQFVGSFAALGSLTQPNTAATKFLENWKSVRLTNSSLQVIHHIYTTVAAVSRAYLFGSWSTASRINDGFKQVSDGFFMQNCNLSFTQAASTAMHTEAALFKFQSWFFEDVGRIVVSGNNYVHFQNSSSTALDSGTGSETRSFFFSAVVLPHRTNDVVRRISGGILIEGIHILPDSEIETIRPTLYLLQFDGNQPSVSLDTTRDVNGPIIIRNCNIQGTFRAAKPSLAARYPIEIAALSFRPESWLFRSGAFLEINNVTIDVAVDANGAEAVSVAAALLSPTITFGKLSSESSRRPPGEFFPLVENDGMLLVPEQSKLADAEWAVSEYRKKTGLTESMIDDARGDLWWKNDSILVLNCNVTVQTKGSAVAENGNISVFTFSSSVESQQQGYLPPRLFIINNSIHSSSETLGNSYGKSFKAVIFDFAADQAFKYNLHPQQAITSNSVVFFSLFNNNIHLEDIRLVTASSSSPPRTQLQIVSTPHFTLENAASSISFDFFFESVRNSIKLNLDAGNQSLLTSSSGEASINIMTLPPKRHSVTNLNGVNWKRVSGINIRDNFIQTPLWNTIRVVSSSAAKISNCLFRLTENAEHRGSFVFKGTNVNKIFSAGNTAVAFLAASSTGAGNPLICASHGSAFATSATDAHDSTQFQFLEVDSADAFLSPIFRPTLAGTSLLETAAQPSFFHSASKFCSEYNFMTKEAQNMFIHSSWADIQVPSLQWFFKNQYPDAANDLPCRLLASETISLSPTRGSSSLSLSHVETSSRHQSRTNNDFTESPSLPQTMTHFQTLTKSLTERSSTPTFPLPERFKMKNIIPESGKMAGVAINALTAVLGSGGIGSATLSRKILAITSLGDCGKEVLEEIPPVEADSNPLHLQIGSKDSTEHYNALTAKQPEDMVLEPHPGFASYRGAILGCLLFVMLWWFFILCVAVLRWKFDSLKKNATKKTRSRTTTHSHNKQFVAPAAELGDGLLPPNNTSSSESSNWDSKSFYRSLRKNRFPGIAVPVLLALYPAGIEAFAAMLKFGTSTPLDKFFIAFGIIVLLLPPFFFFAWVYWKVKNTQKLSKEVLTWSHPEMIERQEKGSFTRRFLAYVFNPYQIWKETKFTESYGAAFDMFSNPLFVISEWALIALMAVCCGVASMCSTSRECCAPNIILILMACMLELASIILLRPFLVRWDLLVLTFVAICNLIMIVLETWSFFGSGDVEMNLMLENIVVIIAQVAFYGACAANIAACGAEVVPLFDELKLAWQKRGGKRSKNTRSNNSDNTSNEDDQQEVELQHHFLTTVDEGDASTTLIRKPSDAKKLKNKRRKVQGGSTAAENLSPIIESHHHQVAAKPRPKKKKKQFLQKVDLQSI